MDQTSLFPVETQTHDLCRVFLFSSTGVLVVDPVNPVDFKVSPPSIGLAPAILGNLEVLVDLLSSLSPLMSHCS